MEKSDDNIEIISIGKLYTGGGPWDKKYWSSSRGKDRYPYPIGYKSLRTQNGVTYRMEIIEGLKGPSFMISSSDGKSCSGDTPDIAWESFQKKGCSQIKLWHGKRFSCKINGVEIFGFKNTFVQRLLRELVANVGGTAEQGMLSSKSSSRAHDTNDQLECKESNPDPNMLPSIGKSNVTGKRSRNDKVVNTKRFDAKNRSCETIDQSQCKVSSPDPNKVPSLAKSNVRGKRSRNDKVVTAKQLDAKNQSCETIDQTKCKESNPDPNILLHLPKSRVTGKRSRSNKVVNTKLLNGIRPKNQHENCLQDDSASNSMPKDQLNCGSGDLATFDSTKEIPGFRHSPGELGPENMSARIESEKCVPIAENRVQSESFETSNRLKVEGQSELISPDIGFIHNSPIDQEPTDRSSNIEVQEFNNSIPEEMGGGINLQNGSPIFTDADLCAPDTFDQAGDSSFLNNHVQVQGTMKGATINVVAKSEDLMTDSLPDDELGTSAYNANSEKCDTDSAGQEIDQSMMTLLLPRALPLLKTFTRKKKKSAKTPTIPTQKSPEQNTMSNISTAREVVEHSDLEIQNTKAHIPNAGHDSVVSASGNSDDVVPDSFDNKPQDLLPYTGIAGQVSYGLDPHAQPSISVKANSLICHDNGILVLDMIDHCEKETTTQKPKNSSDDPRSNIQQKTNFSSKLQGLRELSACFIHPMPISMVQLIVKETEIFICVICGYSEHKESTLFVYKALKKGENMGCPSLIGHAPIALQLSKNGLGTDIAEETILQLTPDAQSLVLLNSIKTPSCRKGKLQCACPACASDLFENNAVKIVQLNSGYTSLVTRLETNQGVCCLLVSEPNFLLASEDGGKLKLWIMNSEWSGHKEEWYLPTFDCLFPNIVELKRIPKSTILVVGHNGFGEFGLWDIDKRTLVSRYSSPGMSVLECMPASILRWQRQGECDTGALIDQIMDATKTWSSGTNVNHVFSPDDKDVAVWLLISTVPDPDSQCYQSCEQEADQVGWWRLALLVNNTVIIGSAVDRGAAAVTSAGHGIMGTCSGLVYEWELSTGMKLGNLHSLNGIKVSCVTTDTSDSGALAIASRDRLHLYLPY